MRKDFFGESRETIIPRILKENGLTKGVEIGVFKGAFSSHLVKNWGGKIWMIDPWRALDDTEVYVDMSNHKNHETAYLESMRSIEGFEDRAFMLRGLSDQLCDLFGYGSIDFAYVDGNHAYNFVKHDIEIWWEKIKPGGFLMGHDYLAMDDWYESEFIEGGKDKHIWLKGSDPDSEYQYAGIFGVNTAVDEFAEKNDLRIGITSEWLGSWIIQKPDR